MKRNLRSALAGLMTAALLSGCGPLPGYLGTLDRPAKETSPLPETTQTAAVSLPPEEESAFQADFARSLGMLESSLTDEQREQLAAVYLPLWQAWQDQTDIFTPGMVVSLQFQSYTSQLDTLTEDQYGSAGYEYGSEETHDLLDFTVADGQLGDVTLHPDWESFDYTQQDAVDLWQAAEELLPSGALDVFDRYVFFTDGEYGTAGYVYWEENERETIWYLALDPADAENKSFFQQTVLHEYFHYLSLCESQTGEEDFIPTDTYRESDFYTLPDSYLNQFYQAFWTPLLTLERLCDPSSSGFYPRHHSQFISDYASTSPAEDIAESFAFYCLLSDSWYEEEDLSVWEEKIKWFHQFPELRQFRQSVWEALDFP